MPTVDYVDTFTQSPFTVPPYALVSNAVRDTGQVRGADPAALLFDLAGAGGEVRYPDYASPKPTLSWIGFAWKLEAADEPAGDINICSINVDAGSAGRLSFAPASNVIYHFLTGGGGGFPSIAYTLGTWVWIEMILNVSANPRRLNTRVNGTDITDVTNAEAASAVDHITFLIGSTTVKTRYSLFLQGRASSDTDWLGESAALEYLPMRGIILQDVSAASVEKTFTLPWELVGAGDPNVLGNVLNTATVPQVHEANAIPTVTDDASAGFAVGDIWIDTQQQAGYWCTSNAVGSAVWKKVTP